MTQSWSGWSGDSSYSDTSQGGRDSGNLSLEEDISFLVIPPPPISSSSSSESFNQTEKSLQLKQGATSSQLSASSLPPPPPPPTPLRARYTCSPSYQRANSIDLLYEREIEETLFLHRSDSPESVDSEMMLPTADEAALPIGQYRINIQSPTSVSEKLKNLLQLIPTPDTEKQSMIGKRSMTLPESDTLSTDVHSFILRSTSESASLQNIFRKDPGNIESSSRTECNQNSLQQCDKKALHVKGVYKSPQHGHLSCSCDKKTSYCQQSSSEGCDQSRSKLNCLPNSKTCSTASTGQNGNRQQRNVCQNVSHCMASGSNCSRDSSSHHNKNITTHSAVELPAKYPCKPNSLAVGQPNEEVNCTQVCSSSETFTALKSKLQAYRDFLLNRKSKSSTNSGGDLRRSNSFTVGTKVTDSMWKAVFSNGNTNKQKVEAPKVEPTPPPVPEKNIDTTTNANKQPLTMQEMSTIPRAIVRRRVNKNQRCLGGARAGPMKALQHIFGAPSAGGVGSEDKSMVSETKVEDISENEIDKAARTDFYELNSKKLKDNPYSTVRMWKPVTLGNQSAEDPERVTRYATFKRLWDSFKIQKMGSEEEGETQSGKSTIDDDEEDNYPKVKLEMLSRIYNNENGFIIATQDIEVLVVDIKMDMENLQNIQLVADRKHFECVQSRLYQQIQQFVHHAKFFLINAALTKEKLVLSLMTCMHSLTRVFLYGRDTMIALNSVHKAQNLGSELIRLANAFKSTMNAANMAAGKPNTDPHVHYLMRQALSLASLLRGLLVLVKSLEFQ